MLRKLRFVSWIINVLKSIFTVKPTFRKVYSTSNNPVYVPKYVLVQQKKSLRNQKQQIVLTEQK